MYRVYGIFFIKAHAGRHTGCMWAGEQEPGALGE